MALNVLSPSADCVSCHTVSSIRKDFGDMSKVISPFRFVSPIGITGYSKRLSSDRWNVRNFGWFVDESSEPFASQRTTSETAAVAASVNLTWIQGATQDDVMRSMTNPDSIVYGPGKNCRSTARSNDDEVYKCFLNAKSTESAELCLKQCQDASVK